MKCKDCAYWYADVDEKTGKPVSHPRCQYPYDDDYAPCSYDENDSEPDYDEND